MNIIKCGINLKDKVTTNQRKFICPKCGCVFHPTIMDEVSPSIIEGIYSVECPNNTCKYINYTTDNLKKELV